MGTTTSNFNLIKPAAEDFYDIADQNNNMDIIDAQLKEIKDAGEASRLSINKVQADTELNSNSINNISDLISSGAVQTPKLAMGANKITIPDVPVSPRIEFTGMSYVNLLGRDGDCEDVSKWNGYHSTLSLDSVNKVSGSTSIKIAIGSGNISGTCSKNSSCDGARLVSLMSPTKYYMLSAYLKNGTSKNMYLNMRVDGTGSNIKSSPIVTSNSDFVRVFVKLQPSDWSSNYTNLVIDAVTVGAEANYGNVDGIMLNEISASDYNNLSYAELLAKYPYVESYGVLTNPYFENRRYNLVLNGNCENGIGYWKPIFSQAKISVENEKFKLVFTGGGDGFKQCIAVKQNTNYYLKGNVSGDKAWFYARGVQTATTLGDANSSSKMFNTGNNAEIEVIIYVPSGSNVCYFDSIMLVEGSTAPAEYKSCDLQRFVVEGQFTQDDTVVIENGKVRGEVNWKHGLLCDSGYNWKFKENRTGYKLIISSQPLGSAQDSEIIVKYDGGIVKHIFPAVAADQSYMSGGYLYLSVANENTGWNDSIAPNDDEVKAFMNGWRAGTNNGTRYTGWVSVVDNTIPSSLAVTSVSGTNASGQNKLNVVDATKLAVNDWIYLVGDDKWVNTYQISAISGNKLTLTYNLTANASNSNSIAKQDQTQIAWVKNNIASNYKGYQLHYKLANPEPVTDINVHVQGDIWDLVKGDNYVYVDSGVILDEAVNPVFYSDTSRYYINDIYLSDTGYLRYKCESIYKIYKNGIEDSLWLLSADPYGSYGNFLAYLSQSNFDTNATYSIAYQILKTLHTQSFGNIVMSYKQSVVSALESHSRELEQKQKSDSTLDNITSMKIFENINYGYLTNGFQKGIQGTRTFITAPSQTSVEVFIPFKVQKVTKPYIFVRSWSISIIDNIGNPTELKSSDLIYGSPLPKIYNKDYVVMRFLIPAGILADNALNYGAYVSLNIDADCKGRI